MNSKTGAPRQVSVRRVVKRFLIIFLPLVVVLGGILAVLYYQDIGHVRDAVEREETHHMSHQTKTVTSNFQVVVSDLMVISKQNELQKILESGEAGWQRSLEEEYLKFAVWTGLYDQIRFLDETGMEVVRVNFSDGKPSIVPQEQLQSKAERYYFKDTFVLGPEEVYVSPFDLNIEHGKIEEPLKPMIRFGTPIFDKNGQKRGIVVLNFLGAKLLQDLEAMPGSPGQMMLLNRDGFWLKGLRPEDEWGFMFEDRGDRTFGSDFPEAWQTIVATESGQFYDDEGGLFTLITFYPLLEGQKASTGSGEAFASSTERIVAKDYYWKVVSYISPDNLKAAVGGTLGRLPQIYAGLVVVLAVGSWALASVSTKRKRAEEELRRHRDHLEELVEERTDELKKSSEQLRTSEASLIHAQRIAHLGNWEWDILKNTLWWSDEIYRIFGLEPQQFGATYEAFLNSVHPDDRAFVQKSVNEALYENKPYSIEHRIVLPDGSVRAVQEQGEVTLNDNEEPIKMLGTVQDITERKNMEEQLIVTDRLASIGELSSGIAHELNNPLTGVIGFSDLLLDRDLPEDIKGDVEIINREAKRTAGVVRNLLTFARKHETEKRLVNINNIVEKVLELRAYEQKVSNIEVNAQFASDLPEIMGDGFRLQQVFINIIINAEHFMKEAHGRGTLTITTEWLDDIIRASFTDDGSGISKENLDHLFDPFFTTKEVGKGTGLGLSISYGIITEHGGRIYAESELGKGATFVIELPVPTTDNEGTTNENS